MRVHEQLTTRACELSCAFCASCSGPDGRDVAPESAEQPPRGRVVRLVGGDPFARRNLAAWVSWARSAGAARVEIEGPGHRLAYRAPLAALVAAKPDRVRVLLPALDEEVSRSLTGMRGVPGRTLAGMVAVRAAGIETVCVVPLNALTAPHVEETVRGITALVDPPIAIELARRALPDGSWSELPWLATLAASPVLESVRLEGYAPCMLPREAWRPALFGIADAPRKPSAAPAPECDTCAWRRRCDLVRGTHAPPRAAMRPLGPADVRALEPADDAPLAPMARWDRRERDLPDLLCFAPFTTMAITELRHRPVPCAQAWVHTAMSPEEEARALDVPVEHVAELDAIARAASGVSHFDAANEALPLKDLWNAPLLRHMRRQMVHGGPSDRCRTSCRVVLGVEERGVDVLRIPDDRLAPEVVRNRALILEDVRAGRDVMRGTPLEVAIGVSAHCNITCGFCSGPGGAYGELSDRRRAELEEMLPGMLALTVSGPGEPLMSKSFQALLAHVASRGYPSLSVSLTTNGTLLTPSWLERHRGVRWGQVRMSINAGSAATHERMTGKKLWHRVVENVEAVARLRDEQDSPFRLTLSCVLSELVMGDLARFADLVHAHRADIVLEPMTGDDQGLSPYKSAERTRRLADECSEVAAAFQARNPKIASAFDAMARFGAQHADSSLVQLLPRR